MLSFKFLSPLDQPLDNFMLIDVLNATLADESFNELKFAVAYAKSGVLKFLKENIDLWRIRKNKSEIFIGIDQKVTSKEALEVALDLFDNVYLINHKSVTFHPKLYLFKGKNIGKVILGSNNLTSGGLESNFESAIIMDLDLNTPSDSAAFYHLWNSVNDLKSTAYGIAVPLDKDLVNVLHGNNLLAIEEIIPGKATIQQDYQKRATILNDIFRSSLSVNLKRKSKNNSNYIKLGDSSSQQETNNTDFVTTIKPADALDLTDMNNIDQDQSNIKCNSFLKNNTEKTLLVPTEPTRDFSNDSYETFLLQIKPHHNGEIFLSKRAVNERKEFFGFPFTGNTKPKKTKNSTYPQRVPDPLVNIYVYGQNGNQLLTLNNYALNMVYYESKSEIRITCSNLVSLVPEYSIMIMNKPKQEYGIDYEIVIHTPDSSHYEYWLTFCNKSMPSGGRKPRSYGWL